MRSRRSAGASRASRATGRTASSDIAVHLSYGKELELRMLLPTRLDERAERHRAPDPRQAHHRSPGSAPTHTPTPSHGLAVTVYPDAEEYIQTRLLQQRIAATVAEIRRNPKAHPLRTTLLKVELLPYQLDGIAFAAGAGARSWPTTWGSARPSRASAWRSCSRARRASAKFWSSAPRRSNPSGAARSCASRSAIVSSCSAAPHERAAQYENDCFFTICNYEQVLRDILAIERAKWDLIVLDEGQRIKNWEAKTTQTMKSLRSPFALVLSGTPLENRLDDLFSVVEFIDDRRLGPAFRFFNRHRVTDEKGKVLGYKNLDLLRESLKPMLLRRTRSAVMKDLPPRTTEIVRIAPTDEQLEHRRRADADRQHDRPQEVHLGDGPAAPAESAAARTHERGQHLSRGQARAGLLAASSSGCEELFEELAAEEARKIVLFSEWTTMLTLIERRIKRFKLDYVRLDGSVPQKKRQQLVHQFQRDPACRVFLTTNAGSTGLNLQAANTVINVDLPWNPAVLEQRIARAHRMGQKNPVQVYLLVTEGTIEEKLLATLSAKHDLALAALDMESNVQGGRARIRHRGAEAAPRGAARREAPRRRGRDGKAAAAARGGAPRAPLACGGGRRPTPCRGVRIPRRNDPAASQPTNGGDADGERVQGSSRGVSGARRAGPARGSLSRCRTKPRSRLSLGRLPLCSRLLRPDLRAVTKPVTMEASVKLGSKLGPIAPECRGKGW